MGYYTYYSLNVVDKNDKKNVLTPELNNKLAEKMSEINKDYFHAPKEDKYDGLSYQICDEEMKWYDHDNDVLELSKRFPEYLFILNGEGENSDDLWVSYYLNGKMQYCPAHIWYDEFDEESLA